jgi:hypothetical protein
MDQDNWKLKIGFDIHGVVDTCPRLFNQLAWVLMEARHEVHIITGPSRIIAEKELARVGMPYTHIFSIVDHYQAKGMQIQYDKNERPWMDPYLWDRAKGEYCQRQGIDLHLDDSDIYGYFFTTPYARFFSKNGDRQRKMKP